VENDGAVLLLARPGVTHFVIECTTNNNIDMKLSLRERYDKNHGDRLTEFEGLEPLVSINCLTYNHVNFIEETFKGFLMQETDFPVEILVHDDASTDGTSAIIREYAANYPKLIKPIIQTENQFSKGCSISSTYVYPKAMGKYIAFCEGDDFWIDANKLQMQCDFLENHPDYSMVDTFFEVCNERSMILDKHLYSHFAYNNYDGDILIDMLNTNFILTCTVCIRKEVVTTQPYISSPVHLDYSMFLAAAWCGKVKHFFNKTACYRRNSASLTFTSPQYIVKNCRRIQRYFSKLCMKSRRFEYSTSERRKMYKNIADNMCSHLLKFADDKSCVKEIIPFLLKYPVLWRYVFIHFFDCLKWHIANFTNQTN
jgi:glycosyltransferase involved in cell wall biosynthesis